MRNAVAIPGLTVLIAAIRLASLSAQDMQAMSKWAAAQVVHYHVSGDFSGGVTVLKGKDSAPLNAKISDHVEFDFDWDNLQQKPIGPPVIKNFPTKVALEMPDLGGCPPPKVNGTYEYWTMENITAMAVMFTLNGKSSSPAGSLPIPDPQELKPCGIGWEAIPASTPARTARLQVPQGMMLAMPSTPGFEMEITADKKSFIQKINTDGWVWTMTPTIVR
jgi:hypothetical protein